MSQTPAARRGNPSAPHLVEHERHAAEAADSVDQQQRAGALAHVAEAGEVLVHARRRLALAEEQHRGLVGLQRGGQLLQAEGAARVRLELDDVTWGRG